MSRSSRRATFAVAGALLLAACGGAASTSESASGADLSTSAAEEAALAPDLEVLGQGPLEGTDVVVWFWASW